MHLHSGRGADLHLLICKRPAHHFEIGPLKFLLGTTWKPGNNLYGILPMILGSIYVTAGAIIVGVPIGLLTAIYMSRFASPRINKVLLPAVQLLAGIPSVVYGFFGMIVMVPAVQAMVKSDFSKLCCT